MKTIRFWQELTWQGTADGVLGFASGQVSGNAFNWRYTFDLKTGEGEDGSTSTIGCGVKTPKWSLIALTCPS